MIHKRLTDKPAPPTSWAGFSDYKTQMERYVRYRVSYEGLRVRAESWPIDGEYESIIDENGPIYIKDGVEYQVHDLNGDRVNVPDLKQAVANEEGFINKNITEAVALFVVDDAVGWLEKNGFVLEG